MKSNRITSARHSSNTFVRRMCGLFVAPLLYIRYSFALVIPFTFIAVNKGDTSIAEVFFMFWFIYAVFFGFIMGNAGGMKYWTRLFQKVFRVNYEVIGEWTSSMMHSHSVWSHPIIRVNGKDHKVSIAVMGGNLYDEEDNIRRKAIMFHLFW